MHASVAQLLHSDTPDSDTSVKSRPKPNAQPAWPLWSTLETLQRGTVRKRPTRPHRQHMKEAYIGVQSNLSSSQWSLLVVTMRPFQL